MCWAETELETIDIGDYRLNCRSIDIAESLGLSPGKSIPQTFQSKAEIKATYNFFSNSLVTHEKILAPHKEKTVERIQEYPVVLTPSDTSKIDYTDKKAMRGKERLTNKRSGLWLHSTIAVTPERLNLGTLEANFWSRYPDLVDNQNVNRDEMPIEEKESFRWLQSYRTVCEVARQAPDTHLIHLTDREGDIIEIYAEYEEQKGQGKHADFICRSQYNRNVEENEDGEKQGKLRKKLHNAPTLGTVEFMIHATEQRPMRLVKQELKAVRLKLIPTRSYKPIVTINAVMAIESNPPKNTTPLAWIFITSLPIKTFDDVSKVIEYYLCRWEIETFFKVLKSGCKVEEKQLQSVNRMKPLIAFFLVLSWRVMFTMMLGRVSADLSCSDLFEASEWKSVYKVLYKGQRLPNKPPRLGEFVIMIARLGGYIPSKNGPPPGVKVIWKGMSRMMDFAIAWEAFGE